MTIDYDRDQLAYALANALKERDAAFELLASEKITRNHIIKRSVEVERERDEARDIGEKLSKQGLEMMDENRTIKRERDEAREELRKLTGTHLSVALSERDDALNQIQGWENKWKTAVEMAAIAENKVSNLEDQVDLAMKTIKRLEANQP